ncbi:MAG: hypothetical protein EPO68_04835 [Planctomycetota bacterium]|nr:MAG: hypothetical protein EPO68_04835 [Planctomycetota bacterium]
MSSPVRLVLLLLALCCATSLSPTPLAAQVPGVSREQMWFAPTQEDWAKPCLIRWQRTWDDAVSVSRATGKAILVCVNMDGEIASEHYAGIRYRRPETAVLYEPYVCVIASVYRHTPRDYDEEGNRIPCPRFGTVTCGEHIWIEPLLYEKFMDGRRIAPRHIGVELDSSEMYDVFYAFDTDTIFRALKEGIEKRPAPPPSPEEPAQVELVVASKGSLQRERVERAYGAGDAASKRKLLEAAIASGADAPVDLLRLAVFGYDLELAALARRALAQTKSEAGIELIGDALRVPLSADERDALVEVLAKLGETSPRARTLATVHRGLDRKSTALDTQAWASAIASQYRPAYDRDALVARVEHAQPNAEGKAATAHERLAFAEQLLALAADPQTPRKYAALLADDAARAGGEAAALGASEGASGWRLAGVEALCAWHKGDLATARAKSALAVQGLPADPSGWNSMAILALFVSARQDAIAQALKDKQPWDPQWMSDVNSTYALLAKHPLGTDQHVASHVDFLRQLGGRRQAAEALQAGLERFPSSWALHQRWRDQALLDRGARGLERAYDAQLARTPRPADVEWYAGYAALVAAEARRRNREPALAVANYQRALELYDAATARSAACKETSDHYAAVALAGLARVALDERDLDGATARIEASFTRAPNAANARDGLNLSAVDTAKTLLARAQEAQRAELAARVQAALDALDPVLLEPPAFERDPQGGAPSRDAQRLGGGQR